MPARLTAMYAVQVTEPGPPSVLAVVEGPDPLPGPGEVVVRVLAATVNPTDLAARAGFTRSGTTPPYVLGWDLAGEVAAAAADVGDLSPGQRVVGMIPWYVAHGRVGAYASHVAVPAEWLVPLPERLDPVVAATVPLNALTADQALDLLDLPSAARLLVTGASGAVGAFAVRLAARAGHEVTAWASSGDEAFVADLGAATTVSGRTPEPPAHGFSSALDAVPVDAPVLPWLADGAAVVTTRPCPAVEAAVAGRGLRHTVVLIRHDRARLAELVAMVAAGDLTTRVDRTLPLAEAAAAHALVEAGGLRGKVVLVP